MPYRRTDAVVRKLAARQQTIVQAARALAAEGGMAAVQIAPVAARAGIAAGTVYRYFPAKTDLVAALVAVVAEQEIAAWRRAADAAPGPLSALAAGITTFAARALGSRQLAVALLAEPVEPEVDAVRLSYRVALAHEAQTRIRTALTTGHLPLQDVSVAAPALIGALIEGLIGPLAAAPTEDAGKTRAQVQTLTLFALRALGVVDARARGLVVQTVMPLPDTA
jgi:AcrR family transcriptional regulator